MCTQPTAGRMFEVVLLKKAYNNYRDEASTGIFFIFLQHFTDTHRHLWWQWIQGRVNLWRHIRR